MNLMELFVKIGVDDQASDKISGLSSKLGNGLKTAAKVGTAAVGAVSTAIVTLGKIGLDYNSQMEQYTTNFTTMLGSQEAAVKKVDELKKFAASTPLSMDDLAKGTQTLLAFGVESENSTGILRQLGDIALGDADKMQRLSTAFGKATAAGKLSGDTVQQMIDAGWNPLIQISKAAGETMEETQKRMSAGAISVEELRSAMEAVTSGTGQFAGGMEAASHTTQGLISTLQDNAKALVGEVFQPISDGMIKNVLPSAIGAIESLTETFRERGINGLIDAAGELVGTFFSTIAEKIPQVIDKAVQFINAFVNGLTNNKSKIASGASKIVSSLVAAIVELFPKVIALGADFIAAFAKGILKELPKLLRSFDDISEKMNKLERVILTVTVAFLAFKGISALVGIINGVKAAFSALNAVMNSNPYLAIATAVVSLIAILASLGETTQETMERVAKFTKAETEVIEKSQKARDAFYDLIDAFDDDKRSIEAETQRTKDLWKELQMLADKNGVVKKGAEERAKYIVGELNEALGTEYEINGRIIKQYGTMREEIDKMIKQRQAERLLVAGEASYEKASADRFTYSSEMATLNQGITTTKQTITDTFDKIWEDPVVSDMYSHLFEGIDIFSQTAKERLAFTDFGIEGTILDDAYTALFALEDSYSKASDAYDLAIETISNYNAAEEAFASGDYQTAVIRLQDESAALWNIVKNQNKISEDTVLRLKTDLDRRRHELEQYKDKLAAGAAGFTQEEFNRMASLFDEYVDLFESKTGEMYDVGADLSRAIANGIDSNSGLVSDAISNIGVNYISPGLVSGWQRYGAGGTSIGQLSVSVTAQNVPDSDSVADLVIDRINSGIMSASEVYR